MDKTIQILTESEGGLSLILNYYPQEKKCFENKRAKFITRNKKVASISMKKYANIKFN